MGRCNWSARQFWKTFSTRAASWSSTGTKRRSPSPPPRKGWVTLQLLLAPQGSAIWKHIFSFWVQCGVTSIYDGIFMKPVDTGRVTGERRVNRTRGKSSVSLTTTPSGANPFDTTHHNRDDDENTLPWSWIYVILYHNNHGMGRWKRIHKYWKQACKYGNIGPNLLGQNDFLLFCSKV